MSRRHLLIGFLVGPLLVGMLVLWLAASEPALRWAARRVTEASGGSVTVTGVSGSLTRTLRIERIHHRTEERIVTVENAELTWSPLQLLRDRVAIDSLSASALIIETLKPSDKPPSLPQRLALPLDLHIGEARIGALALVRGVGRTELRDVRLRLDADENRWQLHELAFETAFGTVSGEGALGTVSPYPAAGALRLRGADARADAVIGGNLADLRIEADMTAYGASGVASAAATPFEAVALRMLKLKVRGFDPSRMRPGWPKAELRIDADGSVDEEGALRGSIALENTVSGPLDRGLLPLRAARAHLAGKLEAARMEDVLLDFGAAGQFAGRGDSGRGASRFALHTDRFDLRGMSGNLKATRIAGDIVLSDSEGVQTLDARLGENGLRLDLNAVRQDDRVIVREAVLRARAGEARASGEIQTAGDRAFRFEGWLRRFDPATLGAWPSADLNLDVEAQGRLTPEWQVAVRYEVQPSRLFGQPLAGSGRFDADARHARAVDATLALGPNTASARGDFGLPGDSLHWQIDAPRLDVLGAHYRGAIKGTGELGGTAAAPRLKLDLSGQGLSLAGYAAQTLQASAAVSEGERDPLSIDIRVGEASGGGIRLQSASLQVEGTRAEHVIRLAARNEDIDLAAQAAGGWRPGSGWDGAIRSLSSGGIYGFALQNPAPLRIGDKGDISLRDFALGLEGGGSINVAVLERKGPRLETRGSARKVPLASLATFSNQLKGSIEGDLTLGADWSVVAADTMNGSAHVFREAGDVILRANGDFALGLTALDARVNIDRDALRAEMAASGERVGTIRANAATQLSRRNGGWALLASSPLRLQATASIPSLAWVGPMSGNPGIEVGGRLAIDATGNGTVGSPRLSGTIAGDELAFRWAEQGIKLHGGVLRAQLAGERLEIGQASISGDEGTLRLEGGARMAGNDLLVDMRLIADRLLLLTSPDRTLVLSGESTLSLDQNRLQLTGRFNANRANLEFPERKNVTVSEDVVVLGQERKKESEKPFPVRYDLDLNLGRNFFVKGKGMDARLDGSVRVYSAQDRLPRARGTIQVTDGTYEAYGQKLRIERGLIIFNGPINNPGLDFLAVRRVQRAEGTVEAGVEVRGTALAPNARLFSNPPLSDTEKLSWLVLGKGTDQASGQDFNALSAAAGALFSTSQAATLQSSLANTFGIDEFGVSTAAPGTGVEGAIVTMGKRISSDVYVTFEQSVTGASSLIKLRYLLSRRLTIEVGAGTSSSVDMIYNWRFD